MTSLVSSHMLQACQRNYELNGLTAKATMQNCAIRSNGIRVVGDGSNWVKINHRKVWYRLRCHYLVTSACLVHSRESTCKPTESPNSLDVQGLQPLGRWDPACATRSEGTISKTNCGVGIVGLEKKVRTVGSGLSCICRLLKEVRTSLEVHRKLWQGCQLSNTAIQKPPAS